MTAPTDPVLILRLNCADRPGIFAAVSTLIATHGGNILESSQFNDVLTGEFFMRVRFTFPAPDEFDALFSPIAQKQAMTWDARREATRARVLILVSELDHCLVDLLYLWRTAFISMEVVGVVSNHDTLRSQVEAHGLPFHHLPVTPETKEEQEARLFGLIENTETDLVVLARYMQILSNELARRLFGRAINIHHSFLPGFKGARPYHQAHARGVKLIGATAHYVTADLDEGPIIEHDVERVTHADSPENFAGVGRRLDAKAQARAVRWLVEQRVFLNGAKTVVFR